MLEHDQRDLDPENTIKLTADDVDEDTLRVVYATPGWSRVAGFGPILVVIVACSVSTVVSLVAWLCIDSRVRAELAHPVERACATAEVAAPAGLPASSSEVTLALPPVEIESK